MGFLSTILEDRHIGTVDHSVQLIQSAISTLPFTLTHFIFTVFKSDGDFLLSI